LINAIEDSGRGYLGHFTNRLPTKGHGTQVTTCLECLEMSWNLLSGRCQGIDNGYWGQCKVELVDKFCYLGDMLSVDGDADAAVKARILQLCL